MRRFIVTISLCGLVAIGCEPETQYNPQSNSKEARTEENCARATAKVMGIEWTPEDGATEQLTKFERKVKECMNG